MAALKESMAAKGPGKGSGGGKEAQRQTRSEGQGDATEVNSVQVNCTAVDALNQLGPPEGLPYSLHFSRNAILTVRFNRRLRLFKRP